MPPVNRRPIDPAKPTALRSTSKNWSYNSKKRAETSVTPNEHSIYTISLFFALNALLLWSNRRHRVARQYRARVAADLGTNDEVNAGE